MGMELSSREQTWLKSAFSISMLPAVRELTRQLADMF